jgi:hypothetical protein
MIIRQSFRVNAVYLILNYVRTIVVYHGRDNEIQEA